ATLDERSHQRRFCGGFECPQRCILRFHDGHRRNEAIAAARQGFYVNRPLRGVSKRLPQFVNGLVETVLEVAEGFVGPQALLNLFASDHLPSTLEEHCEDIERMTSKPDFHSVFADLAGQDVHVVGTEPVARSRPDLRFHTETTWLKLPYCNLHRSW